MSWGGRSIQWWAALKHWQLNLIESPTFITPRKLRYCLTRQRCGFGFPTHPELPQSIRSHSPDSLSLHVSWFDNVKLRHPLSRWMAHLLSKKYIDSSLDAPQLPQKSRLTSCSVRASDRSLSETSSASIGNSYSSISIDRIKTRTSCQPSLSWPFQAKTSSKCL